MNESETPAPTGDDEHDAILRAEQARMDIAVLQAQVAYLSQRVSELAIENHVLQAQPSS